MADTEVKLRLRKSKDGKLYQVIRADGSTRPHFLSLDKLALPIPVAAIRYGRDAHRIPHRSGAFMFAASGDQKAYWRQFVTTTDVVIAPRGDASEEQVPETDPRVLDYFALSVPVRVEDAARAMAAMKRDKAEAATAPAKPAQAKAPAPAAAKAS
jgi:hypothetical protein